MTYNYNIRNKRSNVVRIGINEIIGMKIIKYVYNFVL